MAFDTTKFLGKFIDEAREHLGRLSKGIDGLCHEGTEGAELEAMFRSAHTIKGSARMLRLSAISDTAHRLEDLLDALRSGRLAWDDSLGALLHRGVDGLSDLVEATARSEKVEADTALFDALARPLSQSQDEPEPEPPQPIEAATSAPSMPAAPDSVRIRLDKLDDLINLMGEILSSHARSEQRLADFEALRATHIHAGSGGEAPLAASLELFERDLRDDVRSQELLMKELHGMALSMRMLPLSLVFEPMSRMVRDIASSLGKQAECSVAGSEIELDRYMIERLGDPVLHLLRNAVDHGIEDPEARKAAGKAPKGRIGLSARQDGDSVLIEVSDDGAGIDFEAVRAKALRKALVPAERLASMTTQDLIEILFLPGFSTSPIITEISGRGVGLDVVKKVVVDELRGGVVLESTPGKGAVFTLKLPLSLAMMRVLVVRAGNLSFAFTAQHASELMRLGDEGGFAVAGRRAVIVRNEFVPVIPLLSLVDHGESPGTRSDEPAALGDLLLIVNASNEKLALVVDGLIDERDMVIKPLPSHLKGNSLVSGVVTTGRNELVPVLNVPTLLGLARRQKQAGGDSSGKNASRKITRVLVVDDSINTREIERDLLEAHGYAVSLAEDGLVGWRMATEELYDAVLTDVEMPNMDGFTLTERLRQDERYRDKPIVIITSRQKDEDRRRGIKAGADAYIVKGDFERGNLLDTLRKLGL